MNADLGRRTPEIRSSNEVLPAPDGPKMAVMRLSTSRLTSRQKSAKGRNTFLRTNFISTVPPAQDPFAGPDGDEGQGDGEAQQSKSPRVLPQLHRLKNRE